MTGEYLLQHGFVKTGEEDGYEFLIHQYGGYQDYVFYKDKMYLRFGDIPEGGRR